MLAVQPSAEAQIYRCIRTVENRFRTSIASNNWVALREKPTKFNINLSVPVLEISLDNIICCVDLHRKQQLCLLPPDAHPRQPITA